jgi:hypothetical protein
MRNLCILLVSVLFWSLPAFAQVNFYVGAGGIVTSVETKGLQESGASVGLAVSGDLDDTAFGGQIFAGAMFTPNFGVEVKYSDSGDGEDTITFIDPDVPISVPIDVEASSDGFIFYGVGTYPFSSVVEGSIKLGYTFQDGEIKAGAFGISASTSDDDDGFAIGGALRFRIGDHWAVSGELEYFDLDFEGAIEEPVRFGINAEYHF